MRNAIVLCRVKYLPSFVCMAIFGLTLGCGGSGTNLPEGETGTVSGSITYKGSPLSEGTSIIFIHEDKGITATAVLATDGTYALQMRGGKDILVGSYLVGISPPTVEEELTDEEELARMTSGEPIEDKVTVDFPTKYLTPENSGEKFDVKAGDNVYDLEMKEN